MKITISEKLTEDTFYSLVPLNWLLWITSLSNIHRKGTELHESWSITKTGIIVIICIILNVLCLFCKIKTFTGNVQNGLVKFSDSIQMTFMASFFEYIIDVFFVYKYGRSLLLNYLKAFDYIDTMLGVSCYQKIRKIITNTIIFSVTVFVFNSLFDFISWALVEGWKSTIIYSIDYLYFFFNMLTVLDLISHVVQIEYRLKMLQKLMQGCNHINLAKQVIDKNTSNGITKDKTIQSLKVIGHCSYLETAWFNKCYLLLHEQVDYVNRSYGFRILIYCSNLLYNSINLLNLSIRIINGTMKPDSKKTTSSVMSLSISAATRAFNYGVMAVILTYRCEQTYHQSDKILKTVDMLLVNKIYDCEMKANLSEFRNLLVTRPIKFHAAKFFVIDYTLLVSMSSVVVTYTIIMLQSLQ